MNNPKIYLPFTEGDLEELREGKTFHWTFNTDKGEAIDLELKLDNDNEE